jgi:hypothetical protein
VYNEPAPAESELGAPFLLDDMVILLELYCEDGVEMWMRLKLSKLEHAAEMLPKQRPFLGEPSSEA